MARVGIGLVTTDPADTGRTNLEVLGDTELRLSVPEALSDLFDLTVAQEPGFAAPLKRVEFDRRTVYDSPNDTAGGRYGDVGDPGYGVVVVALTPQVPDPIFFGD